MPAYAELHCLTHFTFLRGASRPAELVQRAQQLGYSALAITDECSVAGVVRAHMAVQNSGSQALKLIAVLLVLAVSLKWMATELYHTADQLFTSIGFGGADVQ